MEQPGPDSAEGRPAERVPYVMGYQPRVHAVMAGRTASEWAGFFIPYLKPGMRLLDCGCGPGSITVGLAEVVAPGEVVGVDIEPRQVARAQALAQDLGLTNARFEVGSVYELPFPDASFDAAFAVNALEHVSEPLRALREMRRVLRPGGVVGVRDPDSGTHRLEPDTPEIREILQLFNRLREESSSPYYAPRQRALLRQAGFVPGEAMVFAECQSTPEDLRLMSLGGMDVLAGPAFRTVAVQRGWIDEARLETLRAAFAAWPDQPDALRALTHYAAVGRAPV